MKLRRGFKKESEEIAVELRSELGLPPDAPLCPWKLAGHLEIPVHTLATAQEYDPESVAYLLGEGRNYFSAVTLFSGRSGYSRFICHNESHAPTRQRANLSHELAHAILLHPATRIFECDPMAEEEAKWLGPTLLVTAAATNRIVNDRLDHETAAKRYGVSVELLRMRINVTGANLIARRKQFFRQKPTS